VQGFRNVAGNIKKEGMCDLDHWRERGGKEAIFQGITDVLGTE